MVPAWWPAKLLSEVPAHEEWNVRHSSPEEAWWASPALKWPRNCSPWFLQEFAEWSHMMTQGVFFIWPVMDVASVSRTLKATIFHVRIGTNKLPWHAFDCALFHSMQIEVHAQSPDVANPDVWASRKRSKGISRQNWQGCHSLKPSWFAFASASREEPASGLKWKPMEAIYCNWIEMLHQPTLF